MSKSTVNRILKDAEALRKQRSSGTVQTTTGQKNAATILQNVELERQRRQNAAANIRTAAQSYDTSRNLARENLTRTLQTGAMKQLRPQIENELNIINKQGRAEDDPAVLNAQKTYADLMTRYNNAQSELAKLPQSMYVGKGQSGKHLEYSPEANQYIQRYMDLNNSLAKRMTQKQEIPRVVNKQYAAFQHGINTPESTESEDYVNWLIEGRDVGLYSTRDLNAMLSGVKNKTVVDEYKAKDDSEKGSWLNPTHQGVRYWDQAMEWNKLHPEGADAEALESLRKYYHDELANRYYNDDEFWQDEREAAQNRLAGMTGRWLQYMPEGERMPVNIMRRKGNYDTPEQMARMDEMLYDAVMGQGAYREEIAGYEGTTFRDQHMKELNERISRAWDYYEQANPYLEGSRDQLFDILSGRDAEHDKERVEALESERNYFRDQIADIENRQNYYRKVADYKAGYQDYTAENSAEDDEQYDRGKYNPNDYRFTLAERGSNNVDDIYSFIIGGKEYRSYVDATKNGWGDKPPDVSKDYKGAMLLQPDEINIFKNLYEAGKKDEASAFLDGLQFAINSRVAPFDELRTREEARAYPILSSIFAQAANVADTALGAMTAVDSALTGMGVDFGPNDAAKDPYSIAYAPAAYSEAVQDEIADMLGPQMGKVYLQSMNSIRNVINGVLMYKLGVPQGMLPTATLATFGTQIYQESMYKHLKDNYDFDKASALSALDTALEIGEELLPIETMFATAGTNIFLRIIANMLSEGGEEFAGSTAGEVLRGIITGRNSWEQRKDQIYAEGGYVDDNGNWIKVGRNKNGLAEANKQAMREWGQNIVEGTLGGFFGGGFGAAYGTITGAAQQRNIGAIIQNRENIIGQQTGPDQLITAALGMDEGTESRKIAEKIKEKANKPNSKGTSNYQLGKLASTMAQESNETVAGIVQDTVENQVREQLASEGVDQKTIDRVAPIVAKGVARGTGDLSISDRVNLATSRNAIDIMRTYIADDGSLAETVKERPEGKTAMNVRQTVSRLLNGDRAPLNVGFATKAVKDAQDAAVVATEEDIADAEGELSGTGTDVIINNRVAQVIGKQGKDQYKVKYADGTEETVDAESMTATNPALATLMEFSEQEDNNINDEAFNAIMDGIQDNADMDGGQYVNEAVNTYLRYRMLGNVKDSKLNAKTLDNIRTVAEKANEKAREDAAAIGAQQEAVVPGQGSLVFEGVKYGEDGWRQKVKALGAQKAEQASALGQLVTMMGNRVKLINDENNPGLFGWEDSTGEIVINLAAKDSAGTEYAKSRNLLTIASHELTHWMEQNSPEAYQQLRQFVFDTLRKQGGEYAVESLVLQTMEDYRKASLTNKDVKPVDLEGAMAEVVANACDNILSNRKLAEDLQAENPNLYQTVKGFVKDFVARMRSATRNMSDTRESRLMKQAGEEVANQLEEYWMAGIREGRQEKQGVKTAEETEDRQLSISQMQGKTWEEQVNRIEQRHGDADDVMVLTVPGEMEDYGIDDMITVRQSIYGKATRPQRGSRSAHAIPYKTMMQLKKATLDPVAKIESNRGTVIVTDLKDEEGSNIILALNPRVMERDIQAMDAASIYGREIMPTLYGRYEGDTFIPNEDTTITIYKNSAHEILEHSPEQYGALQDVKNAIDILSQNRKDVNNGTEPTEPGELTPEESVHPESAQFSVTQMAEASRLGVIEGDDTLTLYMRSPNGEEIPELNKTPEDEGQTWVQVDGVKVKITPDMIRDTPVGMLIDMGLSDRIVNKDGMTQKETARKMFADLMNLCARYRDNNLIWEIAGSEFAETFSALKNNSDPQYRNTVDFGTICSKTQGIVDVLSATMKRRIEDTKRWNEAHPDKQRVFGGLTRQDIMMVYNQTHNANLSVPCPVCYVFSRWMGVPSLLGQMNRFQHNYVVTVKDENGQTVYDKNGDAVIDWDETTKAANDYIKSALKKYGSKDAITNTKTKLQNKISKREEKLDAARKKTAQLKKESRQEGLTADKRSKYEERIKAAEAVENKLNQDIDDFTKQLEGVEAYNWVTQALCLQHTEGQKTVNDLDENGEYIVDRTFRLTPEEILFDLNRTGEFAGYTKNWRYRTTRGAGMGKAIMPYSGASIGDLVRGDSTRWTGSQNPFLTMKEAEARKAFENAKKRVRKQNLVGGQRFQSTSDFRPEWGLDYVMSFLEMQALGSKVQMYTKVREAVDFLGSIGADVNQSIMASGNGWHIATEEEIRKAKTDRELASRMGETYDKDGVKHTYVMDFSDVTGMEYNTAKANSKKYNNVQMILVGMNDVHIRLALANDDIDFVIPWHSSGNSKDVLQQLVRSVDETLTESDDYTKFQEDTKKKGRTAKQEALWEARVKLLQDGADKLTQKEIDILNSNKYTRELYRRFAVEGVDPDCYGVTLPKDQAAKIFPYEYWDKNSTRENADVNGRRFVEYCEAMGLTPRFAMFKDEAGYWKLLIDRKMFDNNVLNDDGTVKEYGKYREQQVVDVTKAEIGQLPKEATAKYGSNYSAETERAIEQSTAALRKKYDMEPGYNPYAEDEEQAEEEQTEGETSRQLSIDQGDMDVRVWMQRLTDGSVSTAQEKAMLKQYQTLAKDLDVERGLLLKRRQNLAEMMKKPNISVYDRKKIRDLEATIETKQKQLNRKEEKLAQMTSQEGFARLMYDQSRIMNELVSGRTVEEVQQTIDDMSGELDMITKQMGEREKEIADLKQKAQSAISALEKVPGAEAAANQLKVIVGQMGLNEKNLQRAKTRIGEVAENAKVAGVRTGNIQKAVDAAIAYNNKLTEQSEAATWQEERRKLVHTLRSEHTQEMLRQQAEFRMRIERNKNIQKAIRENQAMARKIDLNVNRVRQMLTHENNQRFVPEHMKPIAREMLRKIVNNEATGRWSLTGFDSKQLAEMVRVLDAWDKQDGKYTQDSLRGMDEGLADALVNALEDLQRGIDFLNAGERNTDRMVNIQAQKNALTRVYEAVTTITGAIYAERSIALGDRRVAVEDQAYKVQESAGDKRAKELTGSLGRTIAALRKAVTSGNLTPEYFFKMLKNAGLNDLWEEYHRAENRNGLELAKSKAKLDEIAQKYGYKSWDTDARQEVKLASGSVNMTLGQIMSLYATWKREHTLGPAMSQHLQNGGFYVEEYDPRKGIIGRREVDLKAHRVTEADMAMVNGLLTDEQKKFVDDIVGYMSTDMSELGNEASMKAYGIKMYKENYYFPFKMWDGIRSRASNDSGSAAAANDRAFHPSFSKARLHGANNAVVIGDFMTTAADHIVGMINYATMGLANENLQKVLNAQVPEGDRLDTMTKRNIRAVLTEAYGKAAMDYLAKLQEQLNGGAVRVEKSLYDRALTLFRKNAVAGSISVALQQPLSFLRAGMMISPKYMTTALAREYWKGSYQERLAHSGVSVIKDMGRFDMGFGAGAREYITPDGKEGKVRKVWDAITDKATILPELMDRWTWNRMWVAVKAEQHAQNPEMDVKSDEFLDMVGKRFNELMRRTQVYDSTLTKSQNMRSQNPFVKSLTSFMAEPTLTMNVLADAMQNIGEKGGKTRAVKALAIFATSAVAQAAVKALMSSGRSPDDKKTWEENFLYRFYSNVISEGDLLNLVPGYNDLVTVLKEGKLEDDALGMAGKIAKAFQTAGNMFKEGAGYRDYEDGVGQIVQLLTQLPAKNIARDLRAMYNWFIGKPYADRETSAAVKKYQLKEAMMTADNLVGIINAALGEAGYKTNNTAYYGRLYEAESTGNTEEAEAIREYLHLGKGLSGEKINEGLRKQANDRLEDADAAQWLIDHDMMTSTSKITTLYKEGKINAEQATSMYKEVDSRMTDNDIWFKIDQMDWMKETGTKEASSDYYYRLGPALDTNRSAEINKVIKNLLQHGKTKDDIKSQLTRELKDKYLNAGSSSEKVKVRNELQLAYKAIGLTAADADKIIEGWVKAAKKEAENPTKKTENKDTTGQWGKGNINLNKRQVVKNADGSISTERSFSVNIDDKEVLLPTVINGRIVSEEEAIRHYEMTGEYLGKFDTVEEAEEYAEKLHKRQEWYYGNK